jgi:hypothetical protein
MSYRSSGKVLIAQVRYNPLYRYQGGIGGKSVSSQIARRTLGPLPDCRDGKCVEPPSGLTKFIAQARDRVSGLWAIS